MKVDDRFIFFLLQITLHILALSSAKSFNKSLICGGEDNKAADPSLGHFNTSNGEFHCFFQSPNITGIFPPPDAPNRDINVSAVREHCARYSAGLPVIPDPDMFWDVMDMVTKRERLREQQAHLVIVIMGIKNATYVETDGQREMYVTWDDGRTNVYNLSDYNRTHGHKPPNPWEKKTRCCSWYVFKDAKFDTPVLLHFGDGTGDFRTNAYADASLFVLCHQNVTQLLAEGDGDEDIGSTTGLSVPSASDMKTVSLAKPFNKSLICGGEDNKAADPSLGHFNTSNGEFHCFFQSPNITGIRPPPDAPNRGDINVSAVREHCARYSAGLPVIPDPDMFWDVINMVTKRDRLRERQEDFVILIMGIENATYVKAEDVMYVTWDNGRTNVYNLSDETHGQKPPNPWEQKTSCCGWYVMKGAKFDTPVLLHVAGGEFRTDAYADASLFVLCHQNVTQLLAEGDGDNEIGSSTIETSAPSARETVSLAKPFDQSLICGGVENPKSEEDKRAGHYNTSSGEFHCFFRAPNITGVRSDDGTVSVSVAREHCAKYSATLPVIADAHMLWALVKRIEWLGGRFVPIVPLGISNTTWVNDTAHVTWDNGQTDVYDLDNDGNGTHGYEIEVKNKLQLDWCCSWDLREGKPFDEPIVWHVGTYRFVSDPYVGGDLFLVCHQNVTKLLADGSADTTTVSKAGSSGSTDISVFSSLASSPRHHTSTVVTNDKLLTDDNTDGTTASSPASSSRRGATTVAKSEDPSSSTGIGDSSSGSTNIRFTVIIMIISSIIVDRHQPE